MQNLGRGPISWSLGPAARGLGLAGDEASGISGVEQVGFLLSNKAIQMVRYLEDLGEGQVLNRKRELGWGLRRPGCGVGGGDLGPPFTAEAEQSGSGF